VIITLTRKFQAADISGSVVHPENITFQTLLDNSGFRVNAFFKKTDDCLGLKCIFMVNVVQSDIENLNSELKDVEMSDNWQVYETAEIESYDDMHTKASIETPNDLGRFGVSAFCPKTHLTEKEEGEIL